MLISHVGCSADRQSGPPREDVPLPTQPPYTAFVGNLAFDLTEAELGDYFAGIQARSFRFLFLLYVLIVVADQVRENHQG